MITVRGINLNKQYRLTNQSFKALRLLHTPSDLTGKNLIFFAKSLGLTQCFEWISEGHHCCWSYPDADFTKPFIPFKISQGLCKSVSVILLMRLRDVQHYCTYFYENNKHSMNTCGQFLQRINPNSTKSRKYFKMSLYTLQ